MAEKFVSIVASIIIFVLILIVLFMILGQQEKNMEIKKVCFEGKCWEVEVVKSSADKSKGLMNRESLDENAGMFFVYSEEQIVSIWMKNMKIAIDIIWLNKDLEVLYLKENAQPCPAYRQAGITEKCESFKPNQKAMYVLELNAGQIKENNVQLGSKLNFDL